MISRYKFDMTNSALVRSVAVLVAVLFAACGPDYGYGGPLKEECEPGIGKVVPRNCDLLPKKKPILYGDWTSQQDAGTNAGTIQNSDAGQGDNDGDDNDDDADAGAKCKPGNGWGDKNHCHTGHGNK